MSSTSSSCRPAAHATPTSIPVPHEHIPLETFPNHFLTDDKKHLLCSGHGARFLPATGECVSGPCFGKSLTRLAIEERDGALYLADPRTPADIARAARISRRW